MNEIELEFVYVLKDARLTGEFFYEGDWGDVKFSPFIQDADFYTDETAAREALKRFHFDFKMEVFEIKIEYSKTNRIIK